MEGPDGLERRREIEIFVSPLLDDGIPRLGEVTPWSQDVIPLPCDVSPQVQNGIPHEG